MTGVAELQARGQALPRLVRRDPPRLLLVRVPEKQRIAEIDPDVGAAQVISSARTFEECNNICSFLTRVAFCASSAFACSVMMLERFATTKAAAGSDAPWPGPGVRVTDLQHLRE